MSTLKRVAKDICELRLRPTMTLAQLDQDFFTIMRKHGIKQGTAVLDKGGQQIGIACNNFEWTLCYRAFIQHIIEHIQYEHVAHDVPEDLRC